MRIVLTFIVIAILLGLHDAAPHRTELLANDVSWPNCGSPVRPSTSSGIVGINGGLIYTRNPCFDQQADQFKNLAVYLNTGYPGLSYAKKYAASPRRCSLEDGSCLAYNYGFNAARYSLARASLSTALPSRWWLDVETVNSWSSKPRINRAAIAGMIDALSRYASKQAVGIYAAPRQWQVITGSWRNGLPAWAATGGTSRRLAELKCLSKSFTGGLVLMSQYTRQLDENYLCSPAAFSPE